VKEKQMRISVFILAKSRTCTARKETWYESLSQNGYGCNQPVLKKGEGVSVGLKSSPPKMFQKQQSLKQWC
jgi:hypothetical protein